MIRCSRTLRGFQNDVSVLRRIPGADEADGVGHALLEIHMRLEFDRCAFQRRHKTRLHPLVVCFQKFLRHPRLADDATAAHRSDDLQHRRHIVHERDVHHLDLRPERKPAIRDDERVGVTNPRKEFEDAWIENSSLEHGKVVAAAYV